MLRFEDVYVYNTIENYSILYQLLCEREPYVNISHSRMPTWSQHVKYLESKPHKSWIVAYDEDLPVGAMYVTKDNEIGTFVLREYMRKGYATQMTDYIKSITTGTLYANVAPLNYDSQKYCEKMGFKLKQLVYEFKRP